MRVPSCVALLALTACTSVDPLPFEVDGAPGDLVVVVTVADDVVTSRRVTRWEDAPILTVADDEALHLSLIRAGGLVDAAGVPLADERLDAVAVRPAERGACRGATTTAPQIVYPGDVCPLPPFAEHFADPPDAPRPALSLVWPGATTCDLDTNDPPASVTWSLESPDPSFWPHAVYAVLPGTNAIGAFGEHHAIAVPGGATVTPPFVNSVISAVGVADGFVVASHNPARLLRTDVTHFDPDLGVRRGPRDVGFRPERMRRHGDALIVIGEGPQLRQPKARVCDTSLDTCSNLNPDELGFLGRAMLDAVPLADGALLAIGDHGLLVVERIPGADEVLDVTTDLLEGSQARGTLSTTTGTIAWNAFAKAFAGRDEAFVRDYRMLRVAQLADGRALFCASAADTLVLTGDIGRRHAVARPDPLTIVAQVPGRCSGVSVDGEAMRVTTDVGASVVVGVDVETTPRTILPNVGAPAYLETLEDVTIATRADGAVFERSGETFAPRYVPASPLPGAPVEIFETFALFLDGAIQTFDGVDRTLVTTATIVAAAESADGFVIILADDDGLALRRTDGTDWTSPPEPLAIDDVRDLAVVASGAVVLADARGRLHLHDGATRTITIDWDDPLTEVVETAPGQPFGCGFSTHPDDVLRAVAAWGGTAWAAGCDGALLRVAAYAEPPTATRVAFVSDALGTRSFSAALATCPDELLLGTGTDGSDDPRVWRFADCEGAPCGTDADRFMNAPSADPAGLGGVRDLALRDGRTLVLHERGVHFLGSDALFRIEDEPWRGGYLPDGTPVFTTFNGRSFFGRSE
ncbi:MAG: hypothetical protein RIT81_46045 [Deltaproteobacteria bacterium]